MHIELKLFKKSYLPINFKLMLRKLMLFKSDVQYLLQILYFLNINRFYLLVNN